MELTIIPSSTFSVYMVFFPLEWEWIAFAHIFLQRLLMDTEQGRWFDSTKCEYEMFLHFTEMKCTWKRFYSHRKSSRREKKSKESMAIIYKLPKILLCIRMRLESSWTILCHNNNGARFPFLCTISRSICEFSWRASEQCKCDYSLVTIIYLLDPGHRIVKVEKWI